MLIAVAGWVAAFGTAEQRSTLRRDLPWSLVYANNWGQIVGSTPYFAPTDPPVVRHLWSLAVEEQWYVVWPLVFVLLMRVTPRKRSATVFVSSVGIMIATALLYGRIDDNTLYLSTPTRASGLLLGAGAAMVWRPWEREPRRLSVRSAAADVATELVGWLAIGGLIVAMVVGDITEPSTYRWALAMVSVLSVLALGAAVSPASTSLRGALAWRPLVAIGRRSYGLYLWHWPALVLAGATAGGSAIRTIGALAVAAALNEITYRYVEVPVRLGSPRRRRFLPVRLAVVSAAGVAATIGLAVSYADVRPYDAAVGSQTAEFDLSGLEVETSVQASGAAAASGDVQDAESPVVATLADRPSTSSTALPSTTLPATTTTFAQLPRSLVIVGDSQAHSFVVNLPAGTSDYFAVTDGSVDGCGVHDRGELRSEVTGFGRDLTECTGWEERWGADTQRADADVALVMLGAWDVFDLEIDDDLVPFASPEFDSLWLTNLHRGIDAITVRGAQVALLEVPCMRPVANAGAGVPPLPERSDDRRVGHLNDLLRSVADAHDSVWFIEGPDEWCDDPTISADVDYRWDGVHVYQQGADLILTKIALPLLQIPVPPAV
jgi:peptidoglycan/LPS O-acetylase OafA/YrhL